MYKTKQRAGRASDDVWGRLDKNWLQDRLEQFFPGATKKSVKEATQTISDGSEFVVSNDGTRTQHTCVGAEKTITLEKRRK
jgi:hypothetical protein